MKAACAAAALSLAALSAIVKSSAAVGPDGAMRSSNGRLRQSSRTSEKLSERSCFAHFFNLSLF